MSHPLRNQTDCQIYIGGLHPSVVESDLYTLTSQFGQVVYIRILKNVDTKETLGLAFVNYSNSASAQRARNELNGILYKEKHINVSLYCNTRDRNANIFVNDLPPEFVAKDLEQTFKGFGKIISAKISYNRSNKSNRYGYVQFEKVEHALNVINSKDQIFAETKIQVHKFVEFGDRNDPNKNPNLYVRGFDLGYTPGQLVKVFSAFGEVSSYLLMVNEDEKNKRGFAFVCFETPEMAQNAATGLHNKEVEGVNWYVMPHMKREARRKKLRAEHEEKLEGWKKRNLFIKNLPQNINEHMLKQLCDEYGEIESLKIHRTENITYQDGQKVPLMVSNGSAFVCYVNEDSARKAFGSLRNKMIEGKIIFVAMWKPRNELVKNLNAKKFKMFSRQMHELGVFNPMFAQQMRMGRGRAAIPQVMPQMIHPMMPQVIHRPTPQEVPVNRLGFDLNTFNSASQDVQRRMLGEQLYPVVVRNSNEKVAGKITGMLLEIEVKTLLVLIQNPAEILNKVREAVEVLRKAWAGNPSALEMLPY